MIISDMVNDKPLLSGQPPLTHLLVPRGWPLNGGSTVRTHSYFSKSFVLNYLVNKLHTEIFLSQLILGRVYLKRTCNLLK